MLTRHRTPRDRGRCRSPAAPHRRTPRVAPRAHQRVGRARRRDLVVRPHPDRGGARAGNQSARAPHRHAAHRRHGRRVRGSAGRARAAEALGPGRVARGGRALDRDGGCVSNQRAPPVRQLVVRRDGVRGGTGRDQRGRASLHPATASEDSVEHAEVAGPGEVLAGGADVGDVHDVGLALVAGRRGRIGPLPTRSASVASSSSSRQYAISSAVGVNTSCTSGTCSALAEHHPVVPEVAQRRSRTRAGRRGRRARRPTCR